MDSDNLRKLLLLLGNPPDFEAGAQLKEDVGHSGEHEALHLDCKRSLSVSCWECPKISQCQCPGKHKHRQHVLWCIGYIHIKLTDTTQAPYLFQRTAD